MNSVFVIYGIIKVEGSVISRGRRPWLITLAETLITPDITDKKLIQLLFRIVHCSPLVLIECIW